MIKPTYYPSNGIKIDYSVEQPTPHNDVVTCTDCGLKQSKTIMLFAKRRSFWTCTQCECTQKYIPSNSIEND